MSVAAHGALTRAAADRGVSRERAARELLEEHLARQAARSEHRRLTHISTVLSYPPTSGGRRQDGRVRLSLRLDEGTTERARHHGLRLPGQSRSRASSGYGPRPLTDAVVTAVAGAEPFADAGLEGLPSVLTHRQARGLWRLAVASTLTPAELHQILADRGDDPVSKELRDGDTAWHHPWRSEVALHLARRMLSGRAAEENLRMLQDRGDAFKLLRFDLELHTDFDHPYLEGLRLPASATAGRGGAAVWRTQRKVSLRGLPEWLASGPGGPVVVDPPGWELTTPLGWQAQVFPAGRALPQDVALDIAAGKVLSLSADSDSLTVVWPYLASTRRPVPGYGLVLAGTRLLGPQQLVELSMVTTEDLGRYPLVPASTALQLGFITSTEHADLVEAASSRTHAAITQALAWAKRRRHTLLAELVAAEHDPLLFGTVARRAGYDFAVYQPVWTWYVRSIPDTLGEVTDPAQLHCLGEGMQAAYRHALEMDMQAAGMRGHWLGFPKV